jgi:hypothetical protein
MDMKMFNSVIKMGFIALTHQLGILKISHRGLPDSKAAHLSPLHLSFGCAFARSNTRQSWQLRY